MKEWKVRSLIIGTGLGALVGAITAFLLIRQTEKTNKKPQITPAHGVNIGLGIIGLIRQFLDMGGEKK
jgi:gas vesicle protein